MTDTFEPYSEQQKRKRFPQDIEERSSKNKRKNQQDKRSQNDRRIPETTEEVSETTRSIQKTWLHADASDYALGAEISQPGNIKRRPVLFYSRKLLPAEMN